MHKISNADNSKVSYVNAKESEDGSIKLEVHYESDTNFSLDVDVDNLKLLSDKIKSILLEIEDRTRKKCTFCSTYIDETDEYCLECRIKGRDYETNI